MKAINLSLIIAISIFCMTGCASPGTNSKSRQQTLSRPVEIIDNGKALFEEKCAACHGSDGTAGLANAADLQTSRLDSTSIIQIITNGKNTMPVFRDQLGTGEIDQIANYVYTLRK
jgi:mono/diheme cytochrome c family protein